VLVKKVFIFIILLSSEVSSFELDGMISDSEWDDAQKFDNFNTVYPFSLKQAPKKTEAYIFSNKEGIFIGFKNYQPSELMNSIKSSRDVMNDSDANVVVIDFANNGIEAFEFVINSSGTFIDGTFTNGNDLSRDWDGNWQGAVSKGDDYWSSEIFIPWTVATLPSNKTDYRQIRLMFGRYIYEDNVWVSTIKSSYSRKEFLSKLTPLEIKNYTSSKLSFFPYISSQTDSVLETKIEKVGADIFWNTGDGRQINATFNPDFGQAESDDLVVNFSAQETFFNEKRAFFTENHSLFTIKDRDKFTVINTRRIGSAPDYNCLQSADEEACNASKKTYSDLDYAFRFTQKKDNFDIGLFVASESDEPFSKGKKFSAFRSRGKVGEATFGHVITNVKNEFTGEASTVNAIDFDKIYSDKIRIASTILSSKVENNSGYGFKASMRYRPNRNNNTNTTLRYFDKNLDLNDFGYLKDADYFQLSSRSSRQNTSYGDESNINMSELSLWWSLSGDTRGNTNPFFINPQFEYFYKDGSKFNAFITLKTSGKNTTITRKNELYPFAKIKSSKSITADYEGVISRDLEYDWRVSFDRSPRYDTWDSKGYKKSFFKFGTKYSIDENLTMSINFIAKKEKEWLRWLQENKFSSSNLSRREISFNLNWFKGLKHELRLKSQFIALKSQSPRSLVLSQQGYLAQNNEDVLPFNIGQAAFQLRYKYEFAPLSNIYLVYSRGGNVDLEDEDEAYSGLFQDAWSNPSNEIVSIKIRLKY
jgi:hypothetical protein